MVLRLVTKHGSPGNLIDLYATVDVPECEGFGISDFNIKGLRKDSLTRSLTIQTCQCLNMLRLLRCCGKTLYLVRNIYLAFTEHFRTSFVAV